MATCVICGNSVRQENITRNCGRHDRNLTPGITPGGQVFLRGAPSPASLAPRVTRESEVPVPPTSLGIPGFPYFTNEDRNAYIHYVETGDFRWRPTPALILDKFPILTRVSSGDMIPNNVVAIYDKRGALHEIDSAAEPLDDKSKVFVTATGETFVTNRASEYQIVEVDRTLW